MSAFYRTDKAVVPVGQTHTSVKPNAPALTVTGAGAAEGLYTTLTCIDIQSGTVLQHNVQLG
jgi:hypothetical protein